MGKVSFPLIVNFGVYNYGIFRTFPTESFKEGLGEKILLRSLAFHLGLQKAAVLKKKALQFGSKIANSKERAHDISQRLLL